MDTSITAANIYSFLENEKRSTIGNHELDAASPQVDSQSTYGNSATSYTEKWLNSSIVRGSGSCSFYQKQPTMTVPLPTHLETESAEPSPTQAFGPRIVSSHEEDIPGTAMRRTLGLNLSPVLAARKSIVDEKSSQPYEGESSHSNILPDQFGYRQLIPAERKTSTGDNSSIGGSYVSSRKASKSNSLGGESNGERRISKQDREGLDPESLMFRDGRRKVDMVLAWEEEDLGVMTEAEARRRDIRRSFMENLTKEGLEVELEDKSQSFNEKTFFLKIHLPWRLETRLAEVMNLKLPIKRFITISVKPSWVSNL